MKGNFYLLNEELFTKSEKLIPKIKRCKKVKKLIVVEHLVINSLAFLQYLCNNYEVILIPKPKSIDNNILNKLKNKCTIVNISRSYLSIRNNALSFINKYIKNDSFSIIDIGGYFSNQIFNIKNQYINQIDKVIEDTENGQQKYEYQLKKHKDNTLRIASVARSPLKIEEDYLVGHEIVEKSELFLANFGTTFLGKKAIILGYGKIGKSIAENLKNRGVIVYVSDTKATRQIDAIAHGYMYISNVYDELKNVDIIFAANGEKSLSIKKLKNSIVNNPIYVFSVTSSDDIYDDVKELDKYSVHGNNMKYKVVKSKDNKEIIIANSGNAINFTVTIPTLSSFVQLTQVEMSLLLNLKLENKNNIFRLSKNIRETIAQLWLSFYLNKK